MTSPEYRDDVENHPERIPGYDYGTGNAVTSPLTLDDLQELKITVGLTDS